MDQDEVVDLSNKPKIYIVKSKGQMDSLSLDLKTSFLARCVIRLFRGYIKDNKQINNIMWGFVIIIFIVSFLILWGGDNGNIKNINVPNGVMEPGGVVPEKYLK